MITILGYYYFLKMVMTRPFQSMYWGIHCLVADRCVSIMGAYSRDLNVRWSSSRKAGSILFDDYFIPFHEFCLPYPSLLSKDTCSCLAFTFLQKYMVVENVILNVNFPSDFIQKECFILCYHRVLINSDFMPNHFLYFTRAQGVTPPPSAPRAQTAVTSNRDLLVVNYITSLCFK